MTFEHVLTGCAPTPLGSYLKALGVWRVVAEQIDATAQGLWINERFVLRTRLTCDELLKFFVEDYQPTPVVAPWNGGSGFWPNDRKDGIDAIAKSTKPRVALYRETIRACREAIRNQRWEQAPKEEEKAALIAMLRNGLSDAACRWIDSAIALTTDGPRYPPILGTGGNDGRLDFTNNFMRRLAEVLEQSPQASTEQLRSSIFEEPRPVLIKGAVGQFSPGSAGGVNAGTGYESESRVNPWDLILTVEGALLFAAAAVRRFAQDAAAAFAYPFSTRTVGAGSGAVGFNDEEESRAELWTPIWSRPASLSEAYALLSEGRAVLSTRAAQNGLEFARAVASLGVARGIDAFQRNAFLMRAGNAHFAVSLGRVEVRENAHAKLIEQLEDRGWLTRAREVTRYGIQGGRINRSVEAPARLRQVGRNLDEAIFRLASSASPEAVQEVLVALGALVLEVGRRPQSRQALPPPPRLSAEWVTHANDGSHEFSLAAAIASIDARTRTQAGGRQFDLPFRRHLVPLHLAATWEEWADSSYANALCTWTGRHLVRDLCSVLERRLTEVERREYKDKSVENALPLGGSCAASLASIANFLAGDTDDERIADLVAGLAWTVPGPSHATATRDENVLPFAYRVLKPHFAPRGIRSETATRKLFNPLQLVRLIRAGRVDDAIEGAQRAARGADVPAPFARMRPVSTVAPERLAAALLIPIGAKAHESLLERTYPDTKNERKEDFP